MAARTSERRRHSGRRAWRDAMSDSATKSGVQPVDLGYDPWDPAFVADPYPALAPLRDEAPVNFDARTNHWLPSPHTAPDALLPQPRLRPPFLPHPAASDGGPPPPPRSPPPLPYPP